MEHWVSRFKVTRARPGLVLSQAKNAQAQPPAKIASHQRQRSRSASSLIDEVPVAAFGVLLDIRPEEASGFEDLLAGDVVGVDPRGDGLDAVLGESPGDHHLECSSGDVAPSVLRMDEGGDVPDAVVDLEVDPADQAGGRPDRPRATVGLIIRDDVTEMIPASLDRWTARPVEPVGALVVLGRDPVRRVVHGGRGQHELVGAELRRFHGSDHRGRRRQRSCARASQRRPLTRHAVSGGPTEALAQGSSCGTRTHPTTVLYGGIAANSDRLPSVGRPSILWRRRA